MVIKNANVLAGRAFIEGGIQFDRVITAMGKAVTGGGGKEEVLDAGGGYVLPGLVDIHTHGAVGEDFSDGKPEGLQPLADYYAAHGVTSFLATTMTLKEDVLTKAMYALRDFSPYRGAKCAGIHLEGPFLSFSKRGAQAAENLHKPDPALFYRLNEASGGKVRLVTVACEEEGALPFIQEISRSCAVSLGHSVADYETAMAAFEAGATHVTHLFNGMPPLHHRAPSILGAAMDSGASVELICDGLHIHPSVVRAAHRLFGENLNLISDSLRCAGMPDGAYELGGQPITVQGGKATLSGTDTLAGSSISLLDAVRNAVRFGMSLAQAAYAASTAPALAAGLWDEGRLQPGKAADILVLDQSLALKAVFVDGVRQTI